VGAATGLVDTRCYPCCRPLVVEPSKRDVRSFVGQRDRDGRADSLLGTGNQRHPACQFHGLLHAAVVNSIILQA
jgi:hypothetical protein